MTDLVIRNVHIFNTPYCKWIPGDVYIRDGRFYHIDYHPTHPLHAASEVDGTGKWMIPGLIDIHMHIESSMVTPIPYCRKAASCGVTTLVAEPHEMANVAGVPGICAMMEGDALGDIDVFYGISSSVPSTDPSMETTGGILLEEDMTNLLSNPKVVCVGEVMNYRGVIHDPERHLVISRFLDQLRTTHPRFTVEGHCPKLMGKDLSRFLFEGIDGDHTEHSPEEMEDRFLRGMFVELQHKTIGKPILDLVISNNLYHSMCFVTDDTMADVLSEKGCLDRVVRDAMGNGFPPLWAIYCATYTPAQRMKLSDRGTIAAGKVADFVLLDDVDTLHITHTYKNGKNVYSHDKEAPPLPAYTFPSFLYHSVHVSPLCPHDFDKDIVPGEPVIFTRKDATQTLRRDWDGTFSPTAKVAVAERYGKNGNLCVGFIAGDACLKEGAVATTYAHDCHNLLVEGVAEEDMAAAANCVIAMGGGMATAKDGVITARLPLPIGGILSDQPVETVGQQLGDIRRQLISWGYDHYDPIMSLCTLTLPVSPALKITDMGLIDVSKGTILAEKGKL